MVKGYTLTCSFSQDGRRMIICHVMMTFQMPWVNTKWCYHVKTSKSTKVRVLTSGGVLYDALQTGEHFITLRNISDIKAVFQKYLATMLFVIFKIFSPIKCGHCGLLGLYLADSNNTEQWFHLVPNCCSNGKQTKYSTCGAIYLTL